MSEEYVIYSKRLLNKHQRRPREWGWSRGAAEELLPLGSNREILQEEWRRGSAGVAFLLLSRDILAVGQLHMAVPGQGQRMSPLW